MTSQETKTAPPGETVSPASSSGPVIATTPLGGIEAFYRDGRVRHRIFEFLGGTTLENITSRFITAGDIHASSTQPRPVKDLFFCLDHGMEIARSLWDHDGLIAHLDIEYVNFDFPGEAYLWPQRIFDLQAPIVEITEKLLGECGIEALHVLSGRGHHFTWQIPLDSAAFNYLREIGSGPPSSLQLDTKPLACTGEPLPSKMVEAFAGLGMVMELLAHKIKEQAAPLCRIPVELTAVEAGPSEHGREMISIDISEYGDPLQTRAIRAPFSAYLKPWQQHDLVGPEIVAQLPLIFSIPVTDRNISEGILIMHDPRRCAELASRTSTKIPVQTSGMTRLIERYAASSLHHFHDWYYSHRQHTPEEWPETYDQLPLDSLPACARLLLTNPNDLLLHPWGMRLLTRVMLALGWHPRHIAGLIRSKFQRDFGWGDQWEQYHPAMRADFYTRVFAGLFMTRRDDLVDFNCQSFKEEKTCPFTTCPANLECYRQSAMARRRYGHLAHRPFNRLFLPAEHL